MQQLQGETLSVDTVEAVNWVNVLREADTGHLEDSFVLGLDALKETRLREGKLCGGSLQVVVGLCLWHPLHKLRQVALYTRNDTASQLCANAPVLTNASYAL